MHLIFIQLSGCISSFFFYCWVVFFCMNMLHFVYPFTNWKTMGCFQLWVVMNKATINIHIQVFIFIFGWAIWAGNMKSLRQKLCLAYYWMYSSVITILLSHKKPWSLKEKFPFVGRDANWPPNIYAPFYTTVPLGRICPVMSYTFLSNLVKYSHVTMF